MQLADILQLQQFQDVPHSSGQPKLTTEHGRCARRWSPTRHGTALPATFTPELSTELNELWLFLLNSPSFSPSLPTHCYPSPFDISQGHSCKSLVLPIWAWRILLRGSKLILSGPRQQIARWIFMTMLLTAQLQLMTLCPRCIDGHWWKVGAYSLNFYQWRFWRWFWWRRLLWPVQRSRHLRVNNAYRTMELAGY